MATEFITPIQPLKFGTGGIKSTNSVIEEGTDSFSFYCPLITVDSLDISLFTD